MFPMMALSQVAQQIQRSIEVLPGTNYRTIGVKWWGEGAYERVTIDGTQTAAKTLTLVKENDLIINKIWVRNGSTAIASQKVDGCAASGEFPTFELDQTKVLPRWLHWITKTKDFWHKCDVLSQGTSGKNRIRPELFLTITIPLPPLEEQRRIVARIEELAAKIEEARGLRREAVEETDILEKQAYQLAWSNAEKLVEEPTLLEYIADVIDPQPDHRTPAEILDGMPYVSIANIDLNGKIDSLNARKVSLFAIERQEASFKLQTGDIVLGKIGTVGAARPIIVNERFALSANVVLVQPHRNKILDIFLLVLLRAPQAEQQFTSGIHSSAQGAFGIKKMRKLSIPVPPLSTQILLMERFTNFHSNVDFLMLKQSQTFTELNALLPSILDKASKGEL